MTQCMWNRTRAIAYRITVEIEENFIPLEHYGVVEFAHDFSRLRNFDLFARLEEEHADARNQQKDFRMLKYSSVF